MVEIMSHLHQYVPSIEYKKTVQMMTTEETVEVPQASITKILLGGDQLTAARGEQEECGLTGGSHIQGKGKSQQEQEQPC